MAIYEYRCEDCGKVSEILVFSSSEKQKCTHCGSTKLEKLLSSFSVATTPASSSIPAPGCESCFNRGNCEID